MFKLNKLFNNSNLSRVNLSYFMSFFKFFSFQKLINQLSFFFNKFRNLLTLKECILLCSMFISICMNYLNRLSFLKQLEKLQIKINQLELDLAKASTLPVSKPLLENLPAATPTNEGITAVQVLVTVSFLLFTVVVIYWWFSSPGSPGSGPMTKDTGSGFETSIATVVDIGVNTNPVLDSSKGLLSLSVKVVDIDTNSNCSYSDCSSTLSPPSVSTNIVKITEGLEYNKVTKQFNYDEDLLDSEVLQNFSDIVFKAVMQSMK